MKGSISANPKFNDWNIGIPNILLNNPLIALINGHLHFEKKWINWINTQIISCTYNSIYKIILLFCQHQQTYILNQNLQLINSIFNLDLTKMVSMQILNQSLLLIINITNITLIPISIYTNIHKTKYLSSIKFQIKQLIHQQRYQIDTKYSWIKGYHYELESNLIYLWTPNQVQFYTLNTLQLESEIYQGTKKDSPISYVYFDVKYKYTITGFMNGFIKVWRFALYHEQQPSMVHIFEHHTKEITQIIGDNQHNILSCSLDINVCNWSLQTFQLLRVFNFAGEFSRIYLKNYKIAYAVQDDSFGELNLGHPIDTLFTADKKYQNNKISKLLLTLNSNVGLQLNINELNDLKNLNKLQLKYIYPPLKCTQIKQIISCPYDDKHYMLLEGGDIFKILINHNSGIIEEQFKYDRVEDAQKSLFKEIPTIITFLNCIPPFYDTQLIDHMNINRAKQQQHNLEKKQLIAIGCNKGSIIFLKISNMKSIYTRITYHRDKIIALDLIQHQNNSMLFTRCEQRYIKIINFQQNRCNCIYTMQYGLAMLSTYCFQDRIAFIYYQGLFEIAYIQNEQLQTLYNPYAINHQKQILSIDCNKQRKLILTVSQDNIIKIWTYYKILIYQIYFDNGINSAIWTSNLKILIIHHQKIMYLRKQFFTITIDQIYKINKQFYQQNIKNISTIMQSYQQIQQQYLCKKKQLLIKKQNYNQSTLQINNNYDNKNIIQKHRKANSLLSINQKYNQDKKIKYDNRMIVRVSKKKNKNKINHSNGTRNYTQTYSPNKNHISTADLQATRQHLQDMNKLKKITNKSILPNINEKKQDVFSSFIRKKMKNKKMLTRRQIVQDRIILKNILKQHLLSHQQMNFQYQIE